MKIFIRSILFGALALASTAQAEMYDDGQQNLGRNGRLFLCVAAHDAYNGRVDYTVTQQVRSRSECIDHCYDTIVPSDHYGWKYERWHMCWFDNGQRKGWIFP